MLSGRTLYIDNQPLTNAVLEGITEIKPYAFYFCTNLESVTIGDSVTSIGDWAFCSCSSLTRIDFDGTKIQWQSISKGRRWNDYVSSSCKIYCTNGEYN